MVQTEQSSLPRSEAVRPTAHGETRDLQGVHEGPLAQFQCPRCGACCFVRIFMSLFVPCSQHGQSVQELQMKMSRVAESDT